MSVRDGLLAVLSLGPAYGLQLHAEFTAPSARSTQLSTARHRAGLSVRQERRQTDCHCSASPRAGRIAPGSG